MWATLSESRLDDLLVRRAGYVETNRGRTALSAFCAVWLPAVRACGERLRHGDGGVVAQLVQKRQRATPR